MQVAFLARALMVIALSSIGVGTQAQQQLQLTGPRVITPPYVAVPFVSSQMLIKQGIFKNGKCVFSIALSVKPGEVPAGMQLAEIQRAYDLDTCQELVERGLVRSDQIGSDYVEPDAIQSTGKMQASSDTQAPRALSAQIDAYTQVLYTDGNNPIVKPLRSFTSGITTSYVDITFHVYPGDCVTTAPSADYSWSEYANGYTQWTIPTPATAVGDIDCSGVSLDVTAAHRNSFSLPLIFAAARS